MTRKLLLLLPIALLAASSVAADEGMWMPQQMPQLRAELQKLGFEADPARFADLTGDPMGAVVSLGGCTASFVSPDGLVVTNHHCAFGSIQHNSTPERDLIASGFLARTHAEELPAAPGTKVWVTTKIEDVTARVAGGMKANIADAERARLIDRREKELIAECEKPGGVRCSVSSFFEGSQYLRTTRMEITDVRLVYAPSRMIGEFGGEIDNFEWPRHTGDFAFYRAYVGGKPYRPQHWLKLSTEGIDEGDLVVVAGYPGRTFRYKTADEVRNYKEFVYPTNIRYYAEVIRLLEEAGKNNRDVQIRNASRIRGFANSMKNYTSVSEGFTKDRIVEAFAAREEKLRAAIAADPSLAKHAAAFDEIARINAGKLRTRERDAVADMLVGRGSPMLAQAMTIVRLAGERPKKDIDRAAKYQEREWPNLKNASDRAQRTMDPGSDRAVVRYFLGEAAKLPADQRIKAVDDAVAAAGGIEPLLDRLYGATKIGVQEERAKMLGETTAQLRARGDAMIDFVASIVPLLDAREERDLAWTGAMARLRPGYFEVLRKVSGGTLYPDANSTLRLTFGRVEGYRPKDATWFAPQTTLRGLLEKESGKDPFENPKSLLAASADPAKTRPYVDAELKDVPVNFLSTCDTTGGNSGSPTLNAKGELVGLLFDGNYESIDADFLFNPADTRSIHVDAQYMLWVMDAVDGAHELMRELGATPKTK
ncbi:MAG TPA: S46 family peptidase [Thermoanaerobaculia bacterium]|nr:S46 family peptidase [Thermoanaerobaculia bacterium]